MAKKVPFTAAFSSAMDNMEPAGAPKKRGFPFKKKGKGGKSEMPMKGGKKC